MDVSKTGSSGNIKLEQNNFHGRNKEKKTTPRGPNGFTREFYQIS